MTYHRYTRTNTTPLSNWGHAMFARNHDSVSEMVQYGNIHWELDSGKCTPILSLTDKISNAWEECQESGYFGNIDSYFESLDIETVIESFNPENIVTSADAWDSDMVVWFWEFIAEPNNILNISTTDGAISFDVESIQRAQGTFVPFFTLSTYST